jgi:hypothetical protein
MGVSSESLVGPSRERMYCLGHAPVMAHETMGSLCSGLKKQSKAILFSLWAEGVDIELNSGLCILVGATDSEFSLWMGPL